MMTPVLRAVFTMDIEKLHSDILSALPTDPVYISHLKSANPRWTIDSDSFLRHDERIYVPDSSDLRLRVLQFKHDHILSSHPGQNKTLSLI